MATLPAVKPKQQEGSEDVESKARANTLDLGMSGPSHEQKDIHGRRLDREKKIGHRRVNRQTGQVTYKKKPTSELMSAMQLGIQHCIGSLASKPERDLLLQDFTIVESTHFPREGSNLTPAHHYSDFRFKTYAPIAFRYFRELFGIQPDDFLLSMCNEAMTELSNPGASGSIFYITDDDEFIVKTVQHNEADFLQKLLPGYYMNLNQNPRTLLPKFYGLYTYQCGGKNIRFTVMNNLLPSTITLHEKYDLKGSTYKRKASKHERSKKSPTLKDLDFMEIHPEGIFLEADTYSALIKTIERDCRVLQSFKIMDYSLLMAVHNLDKAAQEKEQEATAGSSSAPDGASPSLAQIQQNVDLNRSISRGKSLKQRVAQYSTAMEAIQARADPLDIDNEDIPPGGIPARNNRGERLLLFMGVIDILQHYRFRKKLEHAMKSMVHDGDTISVHRPGFYAQRFQTFFADKVFRKIPSLDQPQVKGPHMRFKKLVQLVSTVKAMKHSPSKKKSSASTRTRAVTVSEVEGGKTTQLEMISPQGRSHSESGGLEPAGAVGGRPDLLPDTTPPPTFSEATGHRTFDLMSQSERGMERRGEGRSSQRLQQSSDSKAQVYTTTQHSKKTEVTVIQGTSHEPQKSHTHSANNSLKPTSVQQGDSHSVPSTTQSSRKEYSPDGAVISHEQIQLELSPPDSNQVHTLTEANLRQMELETSLTYDGVRENNTHKSQESNSDENIQEVTYL